MTNTTNKDMSALEDLAVYLREVLGLTPAETTNTLQALYVSLKSAKRAANRHN